MEGRGDATELHPMSWAAVRAAMGQLDDLSQTQRLVFLGLAYHANRDGVSWPSLRTLADYAGVGRRNAQMAIRDLENRGWITTRKHIRENGSTGTNVYQITGVGRRSQDHGGAIVRSRGGDPRITPYRTILEPYSEPLKKGRPGGALEEDPMKMPKISDLGPPTPMINPEGKRAADLPLKTRTPEGMEGQWKTTYYEVYETPVRAWTGKMRGQGKHLISAIGEDNVPRVIDAVLRNWTGFVSHVKMHADAKSAPTRPQLGFLLAYCTEALSFANPKKVETPKPVEQSKPATKQAEALVPDDEPALTGMELYKLLTED